MIRSLPYTSAAVAIGATIGVLTFPQAVGQTALKFQREIVDANSYPWSSLGKIGNSAGGQCTGVVIGPNQFLTAAHCLYNKAAHRFIAAGSIHFLLGYVKQQYRTNTTAVRYIVPPMFDPTGQSPSFADDWALLYADEPFPLDIKPLRLSSSIWPPATEIKSAGYARERLHMMTADQHCRVVSVSADTKLIVHDCVVEPGDSGGPVLAGDRSNEPSIVGINVGGIRDSKFSRSKGGAAVSAASIAQYLSETGAQPKVPERAPAN
jgi:protease YdgD